MMMKMMTTRQNIHLRLWKNVKAAVSTGARYFISRFFRYGLVRYVTLMNLWKNESLLIVDVRTYSSCGVSTT